MICACGGSCRTSDSLAGTVYTCPACGRREVIDFSARRESPPQALPTLDQQDMRSVGETMELFDRTVKNLLTMPPMPKKRRKA